MDRDRDIAQVRQQLESQFNRQDDILTGIDASVDNLKQMGHTMNRELQNQNVELGDLESGIDENQSRLSILNRKLEYILHDKPNCKLFILCMLFMVCVILLLLVIYL